MMAKYFQVPLPDNFEALSWTARFLWCILASFAKWNRGFSRGECWPSLSKLKERSGLSITTVKKGLAELEDKRLIYRQKRFEGGRVKSTLYMLSPSPDISSPDISSPDISSPDISSRDLSMYRHAIHDVSPRDTLMYRHATTNSTIEQYQEQYQEEQGNLPLPPEALSCQMGESTEEASVVPRQTEQPPLTPEDVEKIATGLIDAYPKTEGRAKVMRMFHRQLDGKPYAEGEQLLRTISAQLERSREGWVEGEERYIPHLDNWLHDNFEGF